MAITFLNQTWNNPDNNGLSAPVISRGVGVRFQQPPQDLQLIERNLSDFERIAAREQLITEQTRRIYTIDQPPPYKTLSPSTNLKKQEYLKKWMDEDEEARKREAIKQAWAYGKEEVPNKMAKNDPRWENKVAWSSKDLREKQKSLETYSCEVAMLFEAVRVVVSRAMGGKVSVEELEFNANFATPIQNNTQRISVQLREPFEMQLFLIRALVDGNLKWSADTDATITSPVVQSRLKAQKINGDIAMNPVTVTDKDEAIKESFERKRRKVRL